MDTAAAALARALPATPTGWFITAVTCAAIAALASLLWTRVRRKWLARASRTLGGRFSGFMSAYYLRLFLPIAAIAIAWAFLAYLWKLPGLIGGVLDLLDTGIDAARDGAPTATDDIRSLAYAFAALAGALTIFATIPFQLVKVWTNERQTRTAEENLTTDLINKAVEGLGAQKEVSRLGRPITISFTPPPGTDSEYEERNEIEWLGHPVQLERNQSLLETEDWQVFTETLPNIEVRLGAIYALERIAQDSPRDHIRVMEILCAYLRENAPARDARRHDLGPWPVLAVFPNKDDFSKHFEEEEQWTIRLENWLKILRSDHPPRADIQAAITVIGRRSPAQIALEQTPKDDGTHTYRLDLRKVNLQVADLSKLNLGNARFDESHLEGANSFETQFDGAVFDRAHLNGTLFGTASLVRASFVQAQLERVPFINARLEGAILGKAHMEGSSLAQSHMQGVWLLDVHLSQTTDLTPVTLRGSGLKNVNLADAATNAEILPRLLSEAFGDASVALPEGLKAGDPPLDHWSTEKLNWPDFRTAWRAHQRAIGYVPPD